MPDVMLRLFQVSWNGLPVAGLFVFAVGGLMYLVMSMSTRSSTSSPAPLAVRRPGWIARRRARGGITHRRDRVGVGYASATKAVHLTVRELAGHGLTVGGPGSGKTTFLQLLVEASAGQTPVVIVDPKGSPALEATVRAHGGQVWTIDGKLPADLLDPRPHQVPDLLLEAEDYSPDARVFRDAAHQRALWAAWALALRGEPMDLARLRHLLDREELLSALGPFRGDARVSDWVRRLEHQHGGVEDSGARGLDRALGILLDGPAMLGSLRSCPEALRLEDVLDTNGLVLFKLDAAEYPHATRKVASWVLLGMGRLARQLPATSPQTEGRLDPRALLLVDEVGALGSAARHLRGLVGRARESGLAVVLATQGPSDLEAVDRSLLPQVLQDTAWQLAFRQGSPQDAERMQALFGKAWVNDESWSSDGRTTTHRVERPRVSIDEWMNALEPGDAWLRVAPVDRGWRQERVRVALPRPRKLHSETSLGNYVGNRVNEEPRVVSDSVVSDVPQGSAADTRERDGLLETQRSLPPVPPDCTPELVEKMGADILAKVDRRWSKQHHELGPCLVWRDGEPTVQAATGVYGRIYDPAIKRSDLAHLVVWRRVYGPIPRGADGKPLQVDHKCDVTLCERPDHLQVLTGPDNTKRRGATRGPNKRASERAQTEPAFAIALFAGIDKTAVEQKTVSLDELRQMLSRFEVLKDKRRGRCWSPTRYADGASSRGNAGVLEVSALVFDLDKVPPDPEPLVGVYWLSHTTWSHTPLAPRWRVVIPLTTPVPAARWRDVWQRARAALCPEADPACKDPSRAYWLPSHGGGVAAKATCHDGALLDVSTLPALPAETNRPELRQSPTALHPRAARDADQRRGEAYMTSVLGKLESMAPNSGRNDALNRAAWTLGRWIAAGALEQTDVEDELYAATARNGLVADDGERQCWATIRSGLSAGLQQPIDLDRSTG